MNEDTNATLVEIAEAPKKRGNPNWTKKENVIKASVTSEYKPSSDIWHVGNKDPALRYHWGRKDDDIEMNDFAQKGYVPAKGNERIMGDPFAAVQDTIGQTKTRGNRILMCCPKELYEAREREQHRHVDARQAAQTDARKMSGQGVLVKPEGIEETTKRESLEE